MEKKELKDDIVHRIWDLRRRLHMWDFIFGKDSSQSKVDEFTKYFSNWVICELGWCLETRILVDLRSLLDQSKGDVKSVHKIFDSSKLGEVKKVFKDIKNFVNNNVAHKNIKGCSAMTRKGTRCKRMTKSSNGKCWQHGGD